MDGHEMTATSVIVMATISIFGSILRVTTPGDAGVTTEAYQALVACAWIVVFGAPCGSLFLTPKFQQILKTLFYLLAVIQLASFGIIKIQTDVEAWFLVGGTI